MSEEPEDDKDGREADFTNAVTAKANRKMKSRRHPDRNAWFGLGMMGLIGWSVVVPTLLGAALGIWIDRRYPSVHSWTLMLLIIGLIIGCVNAWYWVDKEDKAMRAEEEEDNE